MSIVLVQKGSAAPVEREVLSEELWAARDIAMAYIDTGWSRVIVYIDVAELPQEAIVVTQITVDDGRLKVAFVRDAHFPPLVEAELLPRVFRSLIQGRNGVLFPG